MAPDTDPASLTVACVQTTAGPEIEANLAALAPRLAEAADQGAQLITTPEMVAALVTGRRRTLERAYGEDSHPAVTFFAEQARATGAWLLAGSMAVLVEPERVANRSLLFDPGGAVVARYDKIHMFDVDLPGGESYRESRTYRPGERAVLAPSPWGPIGLSVCYDVRFPHLYRRLAQAGAGIITVPAAFTRQTGQAHWHLLLRARAIETGCFIVAPAQCGTHDRGRQTYGHSLIVAPWGEVLADGGDAPGVTTVRLDLSLIPSARQSVPSLSGDRAFTLEDLSADDHGARRAASR